MRLRTRLVVLSMSLVIVPLALLGLVTRWQTSHRLGEQYERRVDALVEVLETDLRQRDAALADRLTAWKRSMAGDARLLRALRSDDPTDARTVLDAASNAAGLLGLSLVLLQDEHGRIVSSAHYRNEFDRVDLPLLDALRAASRPILVRARRPSGDFLAFTKVDSLVTPTDVWYLVAGWEVDRPMLRGATPGDEWDLAISYRGGALSADSTWEAELAADPDAALSALGKTHLVRTAEVVAHEVGPARWIVAHSLAPQRALLAQIDRGLWIAALLAAVGTIALAFHLSARVTRPLERLAVQAERLDLDRLDTRFPAERTDEVGTLSGLLNQMTGRLRSSVARLRDAERRATLGDVARQVNHDLRNGIAPLRNVVRHLSDVAERSPEDLAPLYRERHGTIDSSLTYLDDLANHYARLSSPTRMQACDLESIVQDVAAARNTPGDESVLVRVTGSVPTVIADPIGLRRVIDNLVSNAVQALDDGGRVEVDLRSDDAGVVLRIRDDGVGMTPDELERIFDHFYTTKPTGTGLGLSIVKRLVSDFEGRIRVESRPGEGTVFEVRLPRRKEAPE